VTDTLQGKPKLLYVSTLDHILNVMLPHLDAAREAGWEVHVACQVTRFGEDLKRHTDAIHDLPFRRFPLHPANITALSGLTRLIKQQRFLLVHAHNPTGGFVGRLATTLAGTGAVRAYTAHGFHFHRHGGRVSNTLYKTVETFAGRLLSDGVLVINREDYDAALAGGVVAKERLFLTGGVGVSARDDFEPARVSPEERAALRREIGAEDENIPVLSQIGEMIPRKRQGDALQAFAGILKKHPNALLVLVGDGAQLEERKAEAQTLGIAESVRFLGFRRDVARILAATDVFLFPSRQEGLPCSVQEALSMAVPVVATDVRGNADLVDDTCGRLVTFGDTAALAEKTCDLLALSPEVRQQMGEAGREKMLRLYDRAACVAQWQEIYGELLGRKGMAPRPALTPNPSPNSGRGEPEDSFNSTLPSSDASSPLPELGEGLGVRAGRK
jgi:glycosyltransferase EpsD